MIFLCAQKEPAEATFFRRIMYVIRTTAIVIFGHNLIQLLMLLNFTQKLSKSLSQICKKTTEVIEQIVETWNIARRPRGNLCYFLLSSLWFCVVKMIDIKRELVLGSLSNIWCTALSKSRYQITRNCLATRLRGRDRLKSVS